MKVIPLTTILLAIITASMTSCESVNPRTQQRIGKTATSAIVGGLVGQATGKKGGGFKTGALAGAAGALVGDLIFDGQNGRQQHRSQQNRGRANLPKAPQGMVWKQDGRGVWALYPKR
jgi:uncharacterized protein YcfJ